MGVYESQLGKGQEKSIGQFAQAIRRLSTAHKRATNRSEAAAMQLKWANETHTAQLAKYQADIELVNKRNEALTFDIQRQAQESQRISDQFTQQAETRKTVSKSMGEMIPAWAAWKASNDPEDKEKFYKAYTNLLSADPKQAIEMQRVIGGAVAAETGLEAAKIGITSEMSRISQTQALTRESGARLEGQLLTNRQKTRDLLTDDATIEKYRKYKAQVRENVHGDLGTFKLKSAIEEERRISRQDFKGRMDIEKQKLGAEKEKLRAQMDDASFERFMATQKGDYSALNQIDVSNLDKESASVVQNMQEIHKESLAAELSYSAELRGQEDVDIATDWAAEYTYNTLSMRGASASFKAADMLTEVLPRLKLMREQGAARCAELRATSSEDTTDDTINKQVDHEIMTEWESKMPPYLWGFTKNMYMNIIDHDHSNKRAALQILDLSAKTKAEKAAIRKKEEDKKKTAPTTKEK